MHLGSVLALFAVAVPAVLVNAQSETSSSAGASSTAGITECILNCSSSAASSAGCSSYADLSCVCTSQAFQSQAAACLQSNCTEAELNAALQLQQANCAALSSASSGASSLSSAASSVISSLSSAQSSVRSSVSSRVASATGTAASSSGSASSSSAASPLNVVVAPGIMFSAAVGILGLAIGALVV